MPTAIAVTSPDLVLAPPDQRTPPAHVLTSPDRLSLDDALAEMQGLLERHDHVIVLHSKACPPAFVRRMYTVRSMLESDRIALLGSDLPPLALAVLARQLRQLSALDISPGVLGAAARLLTYYIHAGALLNTVAKLDNVPVSLKAHAKSWVPGSQFAVLAHPQPQLIKLGSDGDTLPGPAFGTHMTVANGQLTSDWVRSLAARWPVQALHQVALPAESERWWGTPKLIEFATGIAETETLGQLVASVHRFPCPWCGLELIGNHCVFCAAPATPPEAPAAPPENQNPADAVVTSGAGPSGKTL